MEKCKFCGAELEPIPPEIYYLGLRKYLCRECRLMVGNEVTHKLIEDLKILGFISESGQMKGNIYTI